ncbi:hypothetical protein TcasGA2_TC006766 [Tribolium castaneum]|uniref:Uncharacterized protein n=1 Tax=Tribolium castaneum TaxID=7070 RepID=D6WUQ0_TRICA|nr:PREDICTED: uncharacterized protein LOC103314132 [Tribolium castaneum]EFA09053.1 hypothetical protein TcasGA2_TC006766 [Tribolium castaneum]|eukprot:XP_008197418.1 PREDICTED: uncharacterized protein LOC103314132 [Tribolium castaneum]
MTSRLHHISTQLENCVLALETDVRESLEQLDHSLDDNSVALEASKDYHFKQILAQLQQIKDCVQTIARHDHSLELLQRKINTGSRIDKNYIRKQVQTFQNLGTVTTREHRPNRPRQSQMKFLECWEQLMEAPEQLQVAKRSDSGRKLKKIVSSTVETFLDAVPDKIGQPDGITEEEEVDTKPRIVEVIYKTK